MLVFPPEIIFWVEEVEVVSYCTAWAPQLSALQQSYSPTISELCSADSDTPEWHTVLTHLLDTREWHTVLTHRSDTPEWHTGVTHRSQPWGRQTAVTRRGWEYPPYHRWPDRSRHSQPATGSWRGITMVVPVHVLKSVSCYFQNWISSSYRERPSLVSSFKLINLVVWRKRQLVKENVEEGFNEIFASFISEFLLNFWSFIFHIYECRCFFLTS